MKPAQIRATGGGANSKLWRQIMADVFDAEVVTLKVGEGAAYGAALQAFWCWRLQQGEKVSIEITDAFVALDRKGTAQPNKARGALPRDGALQTNCSQALRAAFDKHRALVTI